MKSPLVSAILLAAAVALFISGAIVARGANSAVLQPTATAVSSGN